jgi:hypothetical protein
VIIDANTCQSPFSKLGISADRGRAPSNTAVESASVKSAFLLFLLGSNVWNYSGSADVVDFMVSRDVTRVLRRGIILMRSGTQTSHWTLGGGQQLEGDSE